MKNLFLLIFVVALGWRVEAATVTDAACSSIWFGRADNNGAGPPITSFVEFDDLIIDTTTTGVISP